MDKQDAKHLKKNLNITLKGPDCVGDRLATIVTVLQSPILGIQFKCCMPIHFKWCIIEYITY